MNKKIKRIALILLLLPIILLGQEIEKNVNKIIIVTSDNIDDSFTKMGRILLSESYDLEMSDKTFYMITTKVTSKKYCDVKFNFQFDSRNDSTQITLTGKAVDLAVLNAFSKGMTGENGNYNFEKNSFQIKNSGWKKSASKESFNYMNSLATMYSNSKIFYLKE